MLNGRTIRSCTITRWTVVRQGRPNPHDSVRREKVHVPSGCESRPATVAPAGSNRSVGGGNELDEASGAEGRHGRLGEHAGRNVSERGAGLEKGDAEADPAEFGGRPLLLGGRAMAPAGPPG